MQQGYPRPGSADLLNDYGGENGEVRAALAAKNNPDSVTTVPIVKGGMGFGFTIADSAFGQKVKKILDQSRCKSLREGDVLVSINEVDVRGMGHGDVVRVLKDCPRGKEAAISIQRGLIPPGGSPSKSSSGKHKKDGLGLRPKSGFLFRSKTPTADLYSTQEKEKVPNRPKTPLVDTRNLLMGGGRSKTPTSLRQNDSSTSSSALPAPFQRNDATRASLGVGGGGGVGGYGNSYSQGYNLAEQMGGLNLNQQQQDPTYYNQPAQQDYSAANYNGYGDYPDYGQQQVAAGLMPSPGKMYQQQQQHSGGYSGYNGYPAGGYLPGGGGGGGDPGYGYSGARQQPGYSPGQSAQVSFTRSSGVVHGIGIIQHSRTFSRRF